MLSNEDKKLISTIVKNELKSHNKSNFNDDLLKSLKSDKDIKDAVFEMIRKSMKDFYKYMWTNRSTWENQIKP